MIGIELNKENFIAFNNEITKALKEKYPNTFTSETYSGLDLPTKNGNYILLKPELNEWNEAIKDLNINWVDLNKTILLSDEI